MKKADRMDQFVRELGASAAGLDPCYAGFFVCFNRQDYYEAHDVLEHLWLQTTGNDYLFYKGLIQVAGAFVHLKKQRARPEHPKDGRRLRPAARLFRIAAGNLEPFGPRHHHLDVPDVVSLCLENAEAIENSGFARNPWQPEFAPEIRLQ